MFRRREERSDNSEDEDSSIHWSDEESHSDDSASSCSGSELRSDVTSSDEASSSGDEESSSDDSHTSLTHGRSLSQGEDLFGHVSSMRRRTAGRASPSYSPNIHHGERAHSPRGDAWRGDGDFYSRQTRRHRRHGPLWSVSLCFELYHERCPRLCSRRSSMLLVVSLVLWLWVRSVFALDNVGYYSDTDDPFEPGRSVREITMQRLKQLQAQRKQEARAALGSAARDVVRDTVDGLSNMVRKSPGRKKKKYSTVEALPRGCKATEWQALTFPNCNDIHEIDLRESLHLRKGGPKLPDLGPGDKSETSFSASEAVTARKIGYVGSGLWRSVWKVDPRGEAMGAVAIDGSFVAPAVLKVMKGAHEVDPRNLDRHRRDALVMERLTFAPNVVSIYGHCGNTVLTEYVGADLSQVIYKGLEVQRETAGKDKKYTRRTPLGRLRLALDVCRGLAAMHDLPGGPIMHADIQAKQFLVDPVNGVKLNDFNRCRFMPESIKTGKPCPIKIPSAPGGARSPEEYEGYKLTEKIDVYSTANVLYGILTGTKPYESYQVNVIKKRVTHGKKPDIHKRYRAPGTSDAAFAELINKAYELHPEDRISASELVAALERLVEAEEAKH